MAVGAIGFAIGFAVMMILDGTWLMGRQRKSPVSKIIGTGDFFIIKRNVWKI